MPKGTCTICGEPELARGWCARHYGAWRRNGDPLGVGKIGRPKGSFVKCAIGTCPKPVCALGWCEMHYRRHQKYGDPLATKRIIGDIEARFLSHVNKDGPIPLAKPELGPCWLWTGALNQGTHHGYGQFGEGPAVVLAHRWSYEHFTGDLPEDKPHLDHLCKVHACVRPDHLEPVTNRENCLRGANTKMSDEVVAGLYARWRSGEAQRVLAAEVGVDRVTLIRRFRIHEQLAS